MFGTCCQLSLLGAVAWGVSLLLLKSKLTKFVFHNLHRPIFELPHRLRQRLNCDQTIPSFNQYVGQSMPTEIWGRRHEALAFKSATPV